MIQQGTQAFVYVFNDFNQISKNTLFYVCKISNKSCQLVILTALVVLSVETRTVK